MDKNSSEFKQYLYDLVTGSLNQCDEVKIGNCEIKNEYASGALCDSLYREVYQANRRLCERLEVEEDKDVELIISNLLEIAECLAKKMYEYGVTFSDSIKE